MASSVTVQQPPKPRPISAGAAIPATASKSKAGLLIGVALVFLVLLAAGVGGFLLWNKSRSSSGTTTNVNANNTGAVTTPKEVSRYWLELEPAKVGGEKPRVAGLVPIASGQSFSFHFTFDEDGYLYIIGPGDKNQSTAFLTTKPSPNTGLSTNRVSKGSDFSFPKGEFSLTLDNKPGTDNFTVIFSKEQLSSPAFLNEPVTGEPLSVSQQADLKAFITKYQGKPPITELDESNPRAPFVKVKTVTDQSNNPLVFDIRIQHN